MEANTLENLCKGVTLFTASGAKTPWVKQDEWQRNANGFRCTLRYGGRRYSFDFWQGIGIKGSPTVVDCVDCLLNDAVAGEQSFDDFYPDFDFDIDSLKAYTTWQKCTEVAKNMRRLLGDDFEDFLYAVRL